MKALIWKVAIKSDSKCWNISVKKYQKRPTFGDRSHVHRLKHNREASQHNIYVKKYPKRSIFRGGSQVHRLKYNGRRHSATSP